MILNETSMEQSHDSETMWSSSYQNNQIIILHITLQLYINSGKYQDHKQTDKHVLYEKKVFKLISEQEY